MVDTNCKVHLANWYFIKTEKLKAAVRQPDDDSFLNEIPGIFCKLNS